MCADLVAQGRLTEEGGEVEVAGPKILQRERPGESVSVGNGLHAVLHLPGILRPGQDGGCLPVAGDVTVGGKPGLK